MNDLVPTVHPIDRALVAISDAITDLLASVKPSRFAKIVALASTAGQLQRQRLAASVEDVGLDDGNVDDDDFVGNNFGPEPRFPLRQMRLPRFNDGADISREILMLAQGFLKSYMEVEQRKVVARPDTRLNEVMELSELTLLRVRMMKDGEQVAEEINQRVNHLLQRIGEPHAESQPNSVVHPEPLRGYPPNGAGEPDRDRMGEPVAERAGGDLGNR